MLKIIITSILAMQLSATAMQVNSKGEKVSDSQSLSRRIEDLRWWSSFWNKTSLTFIGLTAIAAVGYLISSRFSLNAADNLDKARVEQVADEFAHRDERIARVKADADVQIAGVKAESDEKIAATNLEAARLKEQNLQTESRLEKERNQRTELEKSIGSRWLTKTSIADIEPLRKFAGVEVSISCVPESEPKAAAIQLFNVLKEAGWKVGPLFLDIGGGNVELFDGVVIAPTNWHMKLPDRKAEIGTVVAWSQRRSKVFDISNKATSAAMALGDFLTANNWEFRRQPDWLDVASSGDMPTSIVNLRILGKPNPYFLPEERKKALAEYRRMTEEATRQEKESHRQMQEIEEKVKQSDREHEELMEQIKRERAKPPLVLRPPDPDKPKE